MFCLLVLCLYWLVSVLHYAFIFIGCIFVASLSSVIVSILSILRFANLYYVYALCVFVLLFFVHYILVDTAGWIICLTLVKFLKFVEIFVSFTFYLQYVRSSISKRHNQLCSFILQLVIQNLPNYFLQCLIRVEIRLKKWEKGIRKKNLWVQIIIVWSV